MIEAGIMQLLSVGGDLATMAFLVLLWRMDRRIVRIEQQLFGEIR